MLENIPYFTSTLDLRPSVKDMMVYFRHIKCFFLALQEHEAAEYFLSNLY